VPEDPEHAAKERRLATIARDVLLGQKLDRRLRNGESPRACHAGELTGRRPATPRI
jgi:hypothetical protein